MTENELIALLQQEIKGLSSDLVTTDYSNAVDAAERDTGFTLPVSTDFQEKWLISRSKRHLFSYLQTEAATQTRYHHFHINQKFDHFERLIAKMDKDFEAAQEEYAYEFAGLGALHLAGTKVDAGFVYEDQTGVDLSYDDDNVVIFTPDAND